ncbi:hypothetical protein M407DRAFT_19846 [Tulasnella calospora MUT 4182]|uniref:Uncharacterized protein n=1 Tax=Tulasnella calospora MUT 4182 TaxID=1051891 RepID=A0A0C3QT05_9AGAM|nr:hypothetical protein M407DRAFT_19846 [Tulasnella calospora MUT 4182]
MASENSPTTSASTKKRPHKYGDDAYARKKAKPKHAKSEEESWCDQVVGYGRCINRNADSFSLPRFVINAGMEMEEEDAAEEGDGTPLDSLELGIEDRIWRSSYSKYKQCFPGLEINLVNLEKKSYITQDRIECLLWDGMKSARQADVHLIKAEIHKYHDFQPSIADVKRSSLGYAHLVTGMLLCPAHLDWSDESLRESLRRGEEAPNVDTLFHFMYADHSPSPTSLNRGLLRGPLLVKAYKAVFFGPSSATATTGSGDTRATKSGNAVLGGITKVTSSAIAYITCIVRFALSSEPQFTPGSQHGFDNCGFYRALVHMLEGPNPSMVRQQWRTDLFGWWNATAVPTVSHGISLQELLLAQEEAEESALSDLTNNAL